MKFATNPSLQCLPNFVKTLKLQHGPQEAPMQMDLCSYTLRNFQPSPNLNLASKLLFWKEFHSEDNVCLHQCIRQSFWSWTPAWVKCNPRARNENPHCINVRQLSNETWHHERFIPEIHSNWNSWAWTNVQAKDHCYCHQVSTNVWNNLPKLTSGQETDKDKWAIPLKLIVLPSMHCMINRNFFNPAALRAWPWQSTHRLSPENGIPEWALNQSKLPRCDPHRLQHEHNWNACHQLDMRDVLSYQRLKSIISTMHTHVNTIVDRNVTFMCIT